MFNPAFLLTEFARTHAFSNDVLAGQSDEGAQQEAGPSRVPRDGGYAP